MDPEAKAPAEEHGIGGDVELGKIFGGSKGRAGVGGEGKGGGGESGSERGRWARARDLHYGCSE